ncbi:MAG: hypothetical protein JXA95_05035 [Spirochaetales bacterium]|nr:hypothetical protein [Spirochaetales bacterium]
MKSTEMERKERELRRARKKDEVLARKTDREDRSVGDFIKELYGLFFFDAQKIYNIESSDEIETLLMEMVEELPEKQWDNVLRKAVKQTKVSQKDEAIESLKLLADME